jgi:hypothetical protein
MSLERILAAFFVASLGSAVFCQPASAQWEGVNYMVSPVGCFPRDAGSSAKLELVNGAWAMLPQTIGSAYVLCPINISGDGTAKIKFAQLWFRLPGSAREFMRVNAKVMFRHRGYPGAHLAFQLGTDWDWNFGGDWLNNDYGYANKTAEWLDLPNFGRNYFVEVELRRNQATYPIAFTGLELRFKDPLNPQRDPAPAGDPDPVDPSGSPDELVFP